MSYGISTSCLYPMQTEEALELLGKSGVKTCEVFLNSERETTPQFAKKLKNIADAHSVKIVSAHPFSSFSETFMLFSEYERRFYETLDFYKRFFETASVMGADIAVIHGSLLPEYRGAAPMQRAIIDGKSETGVTTMYMAEGLDTGDMLMSSTVMIEETDDFETVHDKLGECGAALIVKTLDALEDGSAARIPQDDALATYAAKITKETCAVDFTKSAREVHNLIRGLSPIPLALTHTPDGKLLKITKAEICEEAETHENAGEVLSLDGKIRVACGTGSINLLGVLPEGKSRMSASDFIRGRKLSVGDILK